MARRRPDRGGRAGGGPPGRLVRRSYATANYATAHGELTRLRGVGAKIADCVCAFALGKDQAVPVDTHVFQVTRDRYMPELRGKSLTDALYARIAPFWRRQFGPYAGLGAAIPVLRPPAGGAPHRALPAGLG